MAALGKQPDLSLGIDRIPAYLLTLLLTAVIFAMIAVGFHLRHGPWSALTTLGANTSSLARQRLNVIAYVVAGVVTVGFLLPPFAILFGFVS